MKPQEITHQFQFAFEKTSDEIKEKSKEKIAQLKAKITERVARISALREDYGIDDKALVELLTAARRSANERVYTYSSSVVSGGAGPEERTIGAGVVNNLLTESDYIESEKSTVARLEMIVRNLRPLARHHGTSVYHEDEHVLNYEELKFLGF